ncbi:uncharacterized protein PHACADRAFT_149803 [Phanerochaete carnosa HHB-10118-sp]|uniref:F-box domain-containing protein n=1 Tax=Phanerochaete carnosa (strain HHB-10118-sp) TaxID=650164 RepID=K5WR94_PHACS|nr:uncharacterized protein PHACADRAFT_149803 [Phanerochaete carnosa HHB-10118-sp]EKM52877.1 hypothetical protein PHACADRAFT_149803 [Phanerochaete carnosa HHB-10118-sp]
MSRTTGADLPPEILSYTLNCITLADPFGHDSDERRRLKRELVAPSLVCKHWSDAIRPLLFSILELRSAEDVRFLKNIVCSPRFASSSLSGAIWRIRIHQEAMEAKPWLHHVHGLSARLRETLFECTVVNRADDLTPMVGRWAPFQSIPSVTPSYVRLSELTIHGVVFTSTTELARLVDNFPALENCACHRLTFLDPSPVVQSRRARRRASSGLLRCDISGCKDMAVSAQAALAADVVAAGRRMGLDDRTWSATLQALLALIPDTFKGAVVELDYHNGSMFGTSSHWCKPCHETHSFVRRGRNLLLHTCNRRVCGRCCPC